MRNSHELPKWLGMPETQEISGGSLVAFWILDLWPLKDRVVFLHWSESRECEAHLPISPFTAFVPFYCVDAGEAEGEESDDVLCLAETEVFTRKHVRIHAFCASMC